MPRARKSKFMEVSVDRFNEKVEAFNDYLQEEPRKSPENHHKKSPEKRKVSNWSFSA